VPDVFEQELFEQYSTPSLLADARELGIPVHMQMDWCKKINEGKPMRDYMYARLASHVITKHKPNLMMLHLVTVDSAQHSYGRNSPEAYWALNDSDNRVRDMVDAIETAGLTDKTTFFVTTDHGFYNFSKTINLNALLRSEGLLKSLGTKVSSAQAYAMSEGGACFVYILDQAIREKIIADLKPKLLAGGRCRLTDRQRRRCRPQDRRAGPTRASTSSSPPKTVTASPTHWPTPRSSRPLNRSKARTAMWSRKICSAETCVISGAGIKQGVVIDAMKNIDIAPTMAKMLGIEMKAVDGRVLNEALK